MCNLLGNMSIPITSVNEEIVKKKKIIKSTLEYAGVVWNPHLKQHIKKIEKVQRAASR